MDVLGISLGHDTNFALVSDGRLVASVEAERFFRRKRYKLHCQTLEPGRQPSGFQYVDVTELEAFLEAVGEAWGRRFDHIAVQNQGRTAEFENLAVLLDRLGFRYGAIHAVDHHLAHAALGFYTSPYRDALVFSYDGFGNDGNTVMFHATGDGGVRYLHRGDIRFGQSYNNLGYIAGVQPEVCGTSAGKTMGLAAYGTARGDWMACARRYVREYRKILPAAANGIRPFGAGHRINAVALAEIADLGRYVTYERDEPGPATLGGRLRQALRAAPLRPVLRLPGVDDRDAQDLTATVQAAWTAEALACLEGFAQVSRNLCVVGGCALNGVTNHAIETSGLFERIHFIPNPTDCGLAGGAALQVAHREGSAAFGGCDAFFSPYLGMEPFDSDRLPELRRAYPHRKLEPPLVPGVLARLLWENRLIGVIRGRYEVGPRALGNRSILCNPFDPDMRDVLNAKVKHREWYRPFAPVATAEDAGRFFTNVADIPYMSVICHTRPEWRERLPSVTHVDGSARLQTVRRDQNPFLHDILKAFESLSGAPVLLNTSFNPRGEPILNYLAVGLEMLESTDLDFVLIDETLFCRTGRPDLLSFGGA